MSNCVFGRVSLASSGAYTSILQDIVGFTFTNCTFRANTIQANATVYSIYGTRVSNCTFTNTSIIEGAVNLITCDTNTFTGTSFIGAVSGTTVTTYALYVWNISSSTKTCTFDGLTFPVTDNHPYTALLYANAGCSNIKLRNIGTRTSPLTFGGTNTCGLVYTASNNCSAFKIQRVYVSNTRTGIASSDNSCHDFIEQNVFGDYADATDVMVILNQTRMGMGGTGALTAQTSVYGTHWLDLFTSTTAGRIAILMNEATASTTNQVTLTSGAAFTSVGGLYMPNVGQSATFTMPSYLLGHTQYANSALVMAGGTATNYNYNYSIDLNNGAGWSTMTTANYTATTLGTALNALSLNAQLGHKLQLKITTSTANTTAITSVYLTTVSTATAQDYQYPLDTITLTLTGLISGSDIVVLTAGTTTQLTNVDSNPGTSYNYIYATTSTVDIGVFKSGYVPFYIRNYILSSSNTTLPVAQVVDRNYV
jgi:hypothetical protein